MRVVCQLSCPAVGSRQANDLSLGGPGGAGMLLLTGPNSGERQIPGPHQTVCKCMHAWARAGGE